MTANASFPRDSPAVTARAHHQQANALFAGQFVGPTSQAPRDDNLYELETAFRQMTQRQQSGKEMLAPWLVDRLLRNLLVGLTGNTHRAEFCIDKLYSPDTATGRLGILELRAFDMPPHAQMPAMNAKCRCTPPACPA